MKLGFYGRIAADNIRKNPRLYVPRILAEAGLLGCFYIAFALACDERLAAVRGADYVIFFMAIGTAILGALSFVLILYINSFLMKRRKSEYGLFHVLGMEKRHIVRVLFSESLDTALVAVLMGIGFGMLFYKLFSLLICRLLQTEVIAGFYYINLKTIVLPATVFLCFDFLAFVINGISVRRLNTLVLLSESRTGEREPKVKWLMLILGVLTLSAGYVLALTVASPLKALVWFFPAVILVILGTYFLFVTGTTFVLKCLKRNKGYYYNKRHMPAVSGLLFRMKQNAVGLASVAILSTGILVMVSTTVSLYSGMQDTLNSRYPQQLYLSAYYVDEDILPVPADELESLVREAADENRLEIRGMETEQFLSVSYLLRDGKLLTRTEVSDGWDLNELVRVTFITESDYEGLMSRKMVASGEAFHLVKDEIVWCPISGGSDGMTGVPSVLTIGGREYRVRDSLNYFPVQQNSGDFTACIGIILSDGDVLADIYLAQKAAYGDYASEYTDRIAVTFADESAADAAADGIGAAVSDKLHDRYGTVEYSLDTKWDAKSNLLGMYGAFLFLGILLGFVCLFSTILIIYYKQISEGYEDRERFQIMQKIGMEPREVKNTIRAQMVLQFFLPLITAGIHTAAAFPMLLMLLSLLMLSDVMLAVLCAVITFAIFALVYTAVYLLTSKTYYKIVH